MTGYDEKTGTPHVIESRDSGRWIVACLYHPERTFDGEHIDRISPDSVAISKAFVKECAKFRAGQAK